MRSEGNRRAKPSSHSARHLVAVVAWESAVPERHTRPLLQDQLQPRLAIGGGGYRMAHHLDADRYSAPSGELGIGSGCSREAKRALLAAYKVGICGCELVKRPLFKDVMHDLGHRGQSGEIAVLRQAASVSAPAGWCRSVWWVG